MRCAITTIWQLSRVAQRRGPVEKGRLWGATAIRPPRTHSDVWPRAAHRSGSRPTSSRRERAGSDSIPGSVTPPLALTGHVSWVALRLRARTGSPAGPWTNTRCASCSTKSTCSFGPVVAIVVHQKLGHPEVLRRPILTRGHDVPPGPYGAAVSLSHRRGYTPFRPEARASARGVRP